MYSTIRTFCSIALSALTLLGSASVARGDEMGDRIVDYYRRKQNLPPEATVKLTTLGDAKIAGVKSAELEVVKNGQTQKATVVMSADGRYVVFGEVEDVTADPFAAIAQKVNVKDQPSKGPKAAKVTIVEFSDFQCPFCSRAHKTLSEQVLKEYGDKVRLVYKNFPLGFHNWAEPAAIGVECVYQQNEEAFWKSYDFLFQHQAEINQANVKDKLLESIKGTKVNEAKFNECYDGKKTLDLVKADMADGSGVGVTGTPAFLINGRKVVGAQPFESFKAVIDDELKRAK